MSKLAGSKLGYEAGLAHKINTTVLYTTQVPEHTILYWTVLDWTGMYWTGLYLTGLGWTGLSECTYDA